MKKNFCRIQLAFFLCLFWACGSFAFAAQPGTAESSPYVTFSPDRKAWTTNAGEKNYTWHSRGTIVSTGIASALRKPGVGEHLYRYARTGQTPVGRWVVHLRSGQCIHHDYPQESVYHGISYGRKICTNYYQSGWIPYCADCAEPLHSILYYMSREAAASIGWLNLGIGQDYYYLCPHCRNLEQGVSLPAHDCKRISKNRYRVQYDPNTQERYGGFMAVSIHMYDNAGTYEGQPVTPVTRLTPNAYTRIGYVFTGWNTAPDGSGVRYEDCAEIWNLTQEENGLVRLYAQWQPAENTLYIDPAGGSFEGSREVAKKRGAYGGSILLSADKVQPPPGYQVRFETGGGEAAEPVTGTQRFVEWKRSSPFWGKLEGERYTYAGPQESADTVTARYALCPVALPRTKREGYSFGGWYYDPDFRMPAGGPGDTILPAKDTVLYAQWVELALAAKDNYRANGAKGAVDLTWTQPDRTDKTYLVYQSRDGRDWKRLCEAVQTGSFTEIQERFADVGETVCYEVPSMGWYLLTAAGAQGGGYANHSGGLGGSVSASFWLEKGERLTVTVGGQNGENGGGRATAYGNGGGSTVVESDRKGVLLAAGGGGGASASADGGPGGSEAALTEGKNGQDGMAGGGGGYLGGAAGEHIVHTHDAASACYHAHTGNSVLGGGCYGQKSTRSETRVCTPVRVHADTAKWLHGPCGGTVTQLRFDWNGSNGCTAGRHSVEYHKYCSICGDLGVTGGGAGSHTFVYTVQAYALNCGRPSGYFCGYDNGQVISSRPAYGGSSYVNMAYARQFEDRAGAREGDGEAIVYAENIGYREENVLEGAAAPDCAAPLAVSQEVILEPAGDRQVKVRWREPEDVGTDYFHKVESFLYGSTAALCSSNVTRNTLVCGVAGYYYLTDGEPDTRVTAENGIYTEETWGLAEFDHGAGELEKYLHVCPVDLAGNIGETTHIRVEGGNGGVAWKLKTRQLKLEEGENVYPAGEGKTWYVKSDGATPFTLSYEAFVDGTASFAYQPNYAIFEEENGGRNVVFAPSCETDRGEVFIEAEKLKLFQRGKTALTPYPYSQVIRSDENKTLSARQQFLLDAAYSGERIALFPAAGADWKEDVVYSEKERDVKNGVVLIGDGEGPVISGLESLENRDLIDRRAGDVTLLATAWDALSGIKEWYVQVVNSDNGTKRLYRPDETGCIRMEITEDIPLFSGNFEVTAYAADQVGNVTRQCFGVAEFSLEAQVKRILEPHDPVFRRGESGILTFSVWGYADRVEVEFSEEMAALEPGLNRTFFYEDTPAYVHREEVSFMIPIDTPPDKIYSITVRAYKGEQKLEEFPALRILQVEGTVLDQFRTRLR